MWITSYDYGKDKDRSRDDSPDLVSFSLTPPACRPALPRSTNPAHPELTTELVPRTRHQEPSVSTNGIVNERYDTKGTFNSSFCLNFLNQTQIFRQQMCPHSCDVSEVSTLVLRCSG